ncbi:hypothetical protein [Dyella sp. 20L07]|uniref:hypothetical protein n=1 Tax=Dyella sp. 20L07 TaxID=3384240 RepID=UPI003D289D06
MSVGAKAVALAMLGLAAANGMAHADDCTGMSKVASDKALPELRRAFRDAGVYPVEQVDIATGKDCGSNIQFVFEVKTVYRLTGSYWIVSKDKVTGNVSVKQGI